MLLFTVNQHRPDSPQNSSAGSSPAMSHSSSSPAPPSSPSLQESPKNCSYIYRDWLLFTTSSTSKSMSSMFSLPLRSNLSAVNISRIHIDFHQPHDNDPFLSSSITASNLLLTSLKQPSKITIFNWLHQFYKSLAIISKILQRNFHDEISPSGGNRSEASASTAK